MYGGCLEVHSGRGHIAWRQVPETYRLVFARATIGTRYVDPLLDHNLQGIGDTSRWLIPFHVLTAEPGELQCEHFARAIGLRTGVATMIAWEAAYDGTEPAPVALVGEVVRWLQTATGRDPVLRYVTAADEPSRIKECPRMVSSSSEEPDFTEWQFWQQPSLGVVPGAPAGRLDHVWWNGEEEALEGFYRSGVKAQSV